MMELRKTDPEFYERFDAFAFDEVANDETAKLPMETRYLAILAALIGCGGTDVYRELLARALDDGFPAVKARERAAIRRPTTLATGGRFRF